MADPMFNDVQEAFDGWGIAPTSVKFLCLTGGTSYIPVFEETLREKLMLHPDNTRRVQVPAHARLNVVAGAARRPGLRIPGLLPLALQLSWGQHAKQELLRKGTMPGALKSAEWTFSPTEEMDVEFHAVIPDDETRTLFSYRVRNRLLDPLSLEAQARYLPGRILQVRLVWLTIPEEEALPWTTVQVIP
jgi:hypothetical protein